MQKVILTLLTPIIAAGAAWLCATAAKYGVHLDQSGVNALAVAGATAGTAAMLKLIHDLEKRKQVQIAYSKVVQPVERAVVAADPQAAAQVEDAVNAGLAALEAKFFELAGKVPPAPPSLVPPPPAA
jgi:hypothetical protein